MSDILKSLSKNLGIEGIVKDMVGDTGYVVKNGKVYQPVFGGSPIEVGFVKNGKAYMPRFGGDPVPLGDVVYGQNRN